MDYSSYLSMTGREDNKNTYIGFLIDVAQYTLEQAEDYSKLYYNDDGTLKEDVKEDKEKTKYNGWTNRDTWLVMLWINNDYKNYMRLKHKVEGIGTNKKLKDLNCCELMSWLKGFHYGDKIDWHYVNMNEVKEAILEDFEN